MTAPLTDAEIEDARALVEAATAGPLIVLPSSNAEADDCACPVFDVRVADCLDAVTAELCVDVDAALYAAAPDLIRGLIATVDHLRAELAATKSDLAGPEVERWRSLAQQWRTELDTVYERIDAALPEGQSWGNVLARITCAGAEIIRLTADRDEERARLSDQIATHEETRLRQAAVTGRIVEDNGRLRGELARVTRERDEAIRWVSQFSPFTRRASETLADEVAALVRRRVIDSRSPAADALLDYRNPPSTERADRMARLEAEVSRLTAIIDAVWSPVRTAAEVLDEGTAEPPLNEDGTPQTLPAALVVAARCECCGAKMEPGTHVGTFWDEDFGEVVVHWGRCLEPEMWAVEYVDESTGAGDAADEGPMAAEDAWALANNLRGHWWARRIRLVRRRDRHRGARRG